MNYILQGWQNSQTGLCARLLVQPQFFVTSHAGRGFDQAEIIRFGVQPPGSPFEGQLVITTFFGVKPNGPQSPFPYGFAVEPDHV